MPKYELMYILSSAVPDNDVPAVASELDQFIKQQSGTILTQEFLGKRKLAYPIKKTRNGFYVVQTFNLGGEKMAEVDNKIRSLEGIIRYLIVNLEEHEKRKAKTQAVQEKIRASRKPKKVEPQVEPKQEEVKLTETELEQKIEAALGSEDLAKQ